MKKFNTFVLLSMCFILSACAFDQQGISTPDNTAIPDADFQKQVGTVVAQTLTPISAQTTQTPIPDGSSQPENSTPQNAYSGSILGIQFRYPENWYLQEYAEDQSPSVLVTSFDPANPPHKLEWNDQTISIHIHLLPAGSVPQSLEAWGESAKQEAEAMQISIFAEESFPIANQPAYHLTLVSGSGGIIHQVLTILDGRYYEIDIEGNFDTGKMVLETIEVLEPAHRAGAATSRPGC